MMKPMAALHRPPLTSSYPSSHHHPLSLPQNQNPQNPRFHFSCPSSSSSSTQSDSVRFFNSLSKFFDCMYIYIFIKIYVLMLFFSSFICFFQMKPAEAEAEADVSSRPEYKKPGMLDDLFLNLFRNKMVQEAGWDSKKPGYDGLIEVANRLMIGRTNSEATEAAIRILVSLFPPLLLDLYRMLVSPIGGGKVAAIMVARVTALSCQWLMGTCTVNSVDLPDGSSWSSGVFVERCKYLEESKCVGICINTCKLPTQAFFKDYMGVPLMMEPNFSDYSCQFKFGVVPPLPEDDNTLKEPCLDICPNARRRREVLQCPKA